VIFTAAEAQAMTEAEWLACIDPQTMLGVFINEKRSSNRKLHLFACACVRRIWHLLTDERIQLVVEMSEQSADGLISPDSIDETWCNWVHEDSSFFEGEEAEVAALAATGVSARWNLEDAQEYAVCAVTGFQ
jgi:hypothetical protein